MRETAPADFNCGDLTERPPQTVNVTPTLHVLNGLRSYSNPSKAVKCILVALESIIFGITSCSTAPYRRDFPMWSPRSAYGQSLICQSHILVQKMSTRKFPDRIARFSPQHPGSMLPCTLSCRHAGPVPRTPCCESPGCSSVHLDPDAHPANCKTKNDLWKTP